MNAWKWYGFPGHHICGARCRYHLATNIANIFLVSTLGCFAPDPLRQPHKIETIADEATYETMVFCIQGEDRFGNPKKVNFTERYTKRYNDSIIAEKSHYEICELFSKIANQIDLTKYTELANAITINRESEDYEAMDQANEALSDLVAKILGEINGA